MLGSIPGGSSTDLTEDEYLWEPVSPCWSVRTRGPAVRGWGAGDFVCEDAWPPPEPASDNDDRVARSFLDPPPGRTSTGSSPSRRARPDLNESRRAGRTLRSGTCRGSLTGRRMSSSLSVAGLNDESVFEAEASALGESVPIVRLVTTMLTEHVDHLAEIGVLRDLRRGLRAPASRRDHPLQIPAGGRTGRRRAHSGRSGRSISLSNCRAQPAQSRRTPVPGEVLPNGARTSRTDPTASTTDHPTSWTESKAGGGQQSTLGRGENQAITAAAGSSTGGCGRAVYRPVSIGPAYALKVIAR